MRRIVLLLAVAVALPAADRDFNGRWDITVGDANRGQRAWWLEIRGAGTTSLQGYFTGFRGGDTNKIENINIENGELRFSSDLGGAHHEFNARVVVTAKGPKLEGERKSGNEVLRWTGVPAPDIDQHDDGSWKSSKAIELFDGKSLSGWHGRLPDRSLGWSVEDGVLKCTGSANDLVTEQKFWNFDLHVEYRISADSNSGIALRGRYEVQILDDHGKKPDLHSNGSLYSRVAPAVNASKPAGEWQSYDIRLVGLDVTVVLNGRKVIDKAHIDGLTAMGFDANESMPGPIALQGDHGPVEFRRISITPLVR